MLAAQGTAAAAVGGGGVKVGETVILLRTKDETPTSRTNPTLVLLSH